jgi:hypothetical protein
MSLSWTGRRVQHAGQERTFPEHLHSPYTEIECILLIFSLLASSDFGLKYNNTLCWCSQLHYNYMNVILQRQYIYMLTVQDLYDSYRRDCLKYLNESADFPVVKVHVDELSSAWIWQHKLCVSLSAT